MMKATEEAESNFRIILLVPFFITTFVISWAILGSYIVFPRQVSAWAGPLTGEHPLFFAAVWAPAVASLSIIVSMRGLSGLRAFLVRVTLWRSTWLWYAFIVAGIPAVFFAGSCIKGTGFPGISVPGNDGLLWMAMGLSIIKGPVEELGWRGFALPLLQRKLAPVWAGLVLGCTWGLWHLPAFIASGTQQSGWSFVPFFAGTVAISLIMTALFNASSGSILLPAMMHYQLINPLWPDAQPYDTLFLILIAVLILWFNRKTMFAREKGLTRVI